MSLQIHIVYKVNFHSELHHYHDYKVDKLILQEQSPEHVEPAQQHRKSNYL